jgi:hypothetical protein
MKTKTAIKYCLAVLATVFPLMCGEIAAQAEDKKPNILVIWGDDIGYSNITLTVAGALKKMQALEQSMANPHN